MALGDLEKLMKESRFYKETLGKDRVKGKVKGRDESIISALALHFGAIPHDLPAHP